MPVFVGGVIAGITLAGFIGLVAKIEVPPLEAIEKFQTLIVGVIAIGVALATYVHHRSVAAAAQRRLKVASLASLSKNLSEISDYAVECMKIAQEYQGLLLGGGGEPGPEVPQVNRETINYLAIAAANLDSQPLTDLLNTYQVQNARLETAVEWYREPTIGGVDRLPNWRQARKCIDEAARLYVLADRLFEEPRQGWRFLNNDVSQNEIDACTRMHLGLAQPTEVAPGQ